MRDRPRGGRPLSEPSPWTFAFEPLFVALAALAVIAYARAARRDRPGRVRVAAFGTGIALIVVALNSPLETVAIHYLLLVHLLQNVMLADWAPPLLVLGLTAGMQRAVAERGGRVLRVVTRPKVALPVWLIGWYGVHLPAFYDYALQHHWALQLEHAILIAIGLVFWWPVFTTRPHRVSTPVILGYLGVAFAVSAFLGLALTFSETPFYEFYEQAPRLWGLSPAKDQNLGGILMNVEQTAIFLAAIVYFLLRLLAEEEETQRAL